MEENNKKRNPSSDNKTKSEDRTKKKRLRQQYNTSCYCWLCGAGNHSSKDCKMKKDGHKNEATFQHMMGGSSDYCQVVTE